MTSNGRTLKKTAYTDMQGKKMKFMVIFLAIFRIHMANATISAMGSCSRTSKHFVLVHGACHGAWSWYKLVPLLRLSGNSVTALDLAASGINPKQFYDVKTLSDYFQPLMDFMGSLSPHERVILVGHSFGGLAISQAMEIFPEKVAVAVFVTAAMPGPDLSASTLLKETLRSREGNLLDSRYIYGDGPKSPPTAFEFGPKALAELAYQLCPIEDLALARMLLRPLQLYNEEEMDKITLSTSKYGSVSRVYITAEKDKLQEKDYQEWMIKKNPPHQVQGINGSDHMVMLSKPTELVDRLLSIAANYY